MFNYHLNDIKMFKVIKEYIGLFLAIVSAVTMIGGAAVTLYKVQVTMKTLVASDTVLVSEVKLVRKNVQEAKDLLYNLKDGQNSLVLSHNALRDSYMKYLANDQALTKADFLTYMQGLIIEVKKKSEQPAADTTRMFNPKIKIEKR